MLRTRPGKGREKAPPRAPRPPKSSEAPAELPVIASHKDFDRVLRGLLGVPATAKKASKGRAKPKPHPPRSTLS
jgi:hypothetical protein